MVDLTLINTVLHVLSNSVGRVNLTEEIVAIDCETILRRPMISHQIRGALCECQRQGWAEEATDDFGLPVWHITPNGEAKLKAF